MQMSVPATRSATISRSTTIAAATLIDHNNVSGNLQINNDTATTDVSGNMVGHNLLCQNNTPAVTHIALNIVKGQAQGQCAAAP
jgi:hypothetical protein